MIQVGTWNDGINFTAPLSHADNAVVFANKTLRVTTILVSRLVGIRTSPPPGLPSPPLGYFLPWIPLVKRK